MNARFLLSLVATFLLSSSAFASVAYIDNSDYRCSDGKTYDVLRLYQGGWGPGSWRLVAACDQGILNENTYNGRYMDMRDSDPEVASCMDQDTPAVRKCYQEFIDNNGRQGRNLPDLKHFDGVVGATCDDRISKAQDKVDERREAIERNSPYTSQADLDEALRHYGLAVRECDADEENGDIGSGVDQQ